jgi:hypothetical protein
VLAIVNGDGGPPVAGCRRSGDGGTKPTRATADEIRFWREILPVTAYSPFVTVGIDTNSLQMSCLSPPLARQLTSRPRASRRSFIFITLFAQTNQATMVRNDDMIISARAGEGCCCSHRWNNDASHTPLWDSDLHYCRGL